MLLKTQKFEKGKTNFPPNKFFRSFFSRIVVYEKAQGTIYRGPQGKMTGIAQIVKSFLRDLCGRRKNFSKNAIFQ